MPQENQPINHSEQIETVTVNDESENSQQVSSRQFVQIRSAPLPDPSELKGYKQIDKSFPERIISMAEKEQGFRHWTTKAGQAGFIIVVLGGYGIAAYTGIQGAQAVGGLIAVGVSYIAYAFKEKNPAPPKINHSSNNKPE